MTDSDEELSIFDKKYWAIWDEYQRHVAAIKMVGGISDFEVEQGAVVPKGWKHDVHCSYYVPPWFLTSTTIQ